MNAMRQAVIMAGGPGTRLWPLSRNQRPKQALKLFQNRSLLRLAYDRVAAVIPREHIHVAAGDMHHALIADELPELPSGNFIGEPVGRDTANAICLSAALLQKRDPNGTMGVFTADHLIEPPDRFRFAVQHAFEAAEAFPDSLITFGVRPSAPLTSFGYLERGERLSDGVFRVNAFAEKPSALMASQYVEGGKHFWNSGMFVWRTETVLRAFRKCLPQTLDIVNSIVAAWETNQRAARLRELYPTLQRISIDFAVMEKAENVIMVELDCHWADVGSWTALAAALPADAAGNVSTGVRTVHLGSAGNIIIGDCDDHLIATIGLNDLIIIRTDDATLVCSKRDAQGIKELVAAIQSKYGEQYQ